MHSYLTVVRKPNMTYLDASGSGFLTGCSQRVVWSCSYLKSQLGQDQLLSSLMWLLAGFSSFWAVGLRVLVLCCLFNRGLLQFLTAWSSTEQVTIILACFIRESKWESKMKTIIFYNLASEVTSHQFCHILLIRSKLLNLVHTQG